MSLVLHAQQLSCDECKQRVHVQPNQQVQAIDCPGIHQRALLFCGNACYNRHLSNQHSTRSGLDVGARRHIGALRPCTAPLVSEPCMECLAYVFQLKNHHDVIHAPPPTASGTPPLTQDDVANAPAATKEDAPASDAIAAAVAAAAVFNATLHASTPASTRVPIAFPHADENPALQRTPPNHATAPSPADLAVRMDRIEAKLDDLLSMLKHSRGK